jgi:hypothetical protein
MKTIVIGMMRAAVVGGGIGGLTTVRWLAYRRLFLSPGC